MSWRIPQLEKNENIMAWISGCSVGPSFLGLDSSPSWDLSGGMTFPFQQSHSLSCVTTHLFNKYFMPFSPRRITSFSLFFHLSTWSYSHRLYGPEDINLPGSHTFFLDQSQPCSFWIMWWKSRHRGNREISVPQQSGACLNRKWVSS